MKTTQQHLLTKTALLALAILFLTACGTLEVGIEPAAETLVPTGIALQPDGSPTTGPIQATEPVPVTAEPALPTPSLVPTPTVEPTATATPPAGALFVAYVKAGDIWLWNENDGPRQLTVDGGVEQVRMSDDGRRVAFVRDGDIWTVEADGTDERRLTSAAELTGGEYSGIDFTAGRGFTVLGVLPYQFEWLPGGRQLLFNTSPQIEGPGLLLSDDLWAVDVDSGSVQNLLLPGDGGNFLLSPDGSKLALTTSGKISVAGVDGSRLTELFTYAPVLTYSEFEYYAQPAWTPASDALLVAIPPEDRLAMPDQLTSVWHLSADGVSARLMGNITEALIPGSTALFSPDGGRVAFVSGSAPDTQHISVAEFGEMGVQEPAVYPAVAEMLGSWSPDSTQFIFAPPSAGTPMQLVGAIGREPIVIGAGAGAILDAGWVDAARLLYLQGDGAGGWAIVLGDLAGGAPAVIDRMTGSPPAIDMIVYAGA